MEKYVCTFDEATLKVAIEELNEEPDQRESQVETFRQWILQQNHLKCPTDTEYLLRFLRTAKFSQLRARRTLEGHLTQKVLYPQWLADIDITSPEIQKVLKSKSILPLPEKDEKGRKILLADHGAIDPDTKIWDPVTINRAVFAVYHYLTMDESNIVNGINVVIDHTNFTMKWLHFLGFDTLPKALKAWQGNLTGRLKGYHFYNPGKIFEVLLGIIRPVLSQKFKDRIYTHGTMEDVYKVIPMKILPVEYLPDDYTGPNAGTLQEICDKFLAETQTPRVRNHILHVSSSKWKSNMCLKEEGTNESFRKLNIE